MSILKFFLIEHPSKSINKSSVTQQFIDVKISDTFDSLKKTLGITHDVLFTDKPPDYTQFNSVKSILSFNKFQNSMRYDKKISEIYVVPIPSLKEYRKNAQNQLESSGFNFSRIYTPEHRCNCNKFRFCNCNAFEFLEKNL